MPIRYVLPIALLMIGNLAAASPTGPARLEGLNYDAARAVILGYGWRPFHDDECGGIPVEASTCARYPELNYCSGTGLGLCRMTFTRADRCLYVVTAESPPGQGRYTVVHRLWFSRGACQREAS